MSSELAANNLRKSVEFLRNGDIGRTRSESKRATKSSQKCIELDEYGTGLHRWAEIPDVLFVQGRVRSLRFTLRSLADERGNNHTRLISGYTQENVIHSIRVV
jgi:hypothetical protein